MAVDAAIVRMNLGNTLLHQGKYAEAETAYARAIDEMTGRARDGATRIDRSLGQALMLRAHALIKLGDSESSRRCLKEGMAQYEAAEDCQFPIDEAMERILYHAQASMLYDVLGEPPGLLEHADAALGCLDRTVRIRERGQVLGEPSRSLAAPARQEGERRDRHAAPSVRPSLLNRR